MSAAAAAKVTASVLGKIAPNTPFPEILKGTPGLKGPYAVVHAIPVQPLQSRMTELTVRYSRAYQNFMKEIKSQGCEKDIRLFFEASVQTPLPAELVYRVRNWYIMNRVVMNDAHKKVLLTTFCNIINAERKLKRLTYPDDKTIKPDIIIKPGYAKVEVNKNLKQVINWDRATVIYEGDLKDLCVHVETRLPHTEYQYMTVRCSYMDKDVVQDSFHMMFELGCMAYRLPMSCSFCQKVPIAPKICACKEDDKSCVCKPGPVPSFKPCTVCCVSYYCSDNCQKQHEPTHSCGDVPRLVLKNLHQTMLNRVVRAHAIKVWFVRETKDQVEMASQIMTFGNCDPEPMSPTQQRDMIYAVQLRLADKPKPHEKPKPKPSESAASPVVESVPPTPPPPSSDTKSPDAKTAQEHKP